MVGPQNVGLFNFSPKASYNLYEPFHVVIINTKLEVDPSSCLKNTKINYFKLEYKFCAEILLTPKILSNVLDQIFQITVINDMYYIIV